MEGETVNIRGEERGREKGDERARKGNKGKVWTRGVMQKEAREEGRNEGRKEVVKERRKINK